MRTLSTQTAILIGSLMISISILIHGGIIKVGSLNTNNNQATGTQAPAAAAQPVAKTESQIVDKLKEYAGKLGLDTGKFNQCLDSNSKATLVKADQDDGTTLGVQGTPSFFVNGKPLFIGAAPYSDFKKALDDELAGAVAAADKKNVSLGNLPSLGNASAPVTLVEFSDYQCPFCGRFFTDAEVQIKKDYVNTGKVKIVYRDFPLTQIHPGAQKGAEAARCAGDQGKYWEYHDLVFGNQNDIF